MDATLEHAGIIAIYGDSTVKILETIQFDLEQATLDADDTHTIDAVAEILANHSFDLEVEAHADPTEKSWQISRRRGQRVIDELVRRGIERKRLHLRDHRKTRSLAPEGSRPNARVRLRVLEVDAG